MKKIEKITVLASTVLISAIFSPEAHAESENFNILDQEVEATDKLENDIYEYKQVENEKVQQAEEHAYDQVVENDQKEPVEETNLTKEYQDQAPVENEDLGEDRNQVYLYNSQSARRDSKEDDLEVKEDLKEDQSTNLVEDDKTIEENSPQVSPEDEMAPLMTTSSSVSNEPVKEKQAEEKTSSQAVTYASTASTFSLKDLYFYNKIDLDKDFIEKKKDIGKNTEEKKEEKKETNNNSKKLKEVDKSSDGRYVLKTDGKKNYYFDNGVLMKNKDTVLNGKFYTLESDGQAKVATNKWVNVNGVKYYANQYGYTQLGLKKIGNQTYHFEQDGKLSSNKNVFVNSTFYKVNDKGVARTIRNQWLDYGGETFYVNKYGGKAKGFTEISGKTYHFSDNGMTKNVPVFYSGDKFYKIDSKGVVSPHRNAWVDYKGKRFYANKEGWRSQGVTNINGKVYNLTPNGLGKDYYLYVSRDNATYYFDKNGVGTIVSRGKPSKDLDVALGWMYDKMNYNIQYAMDGRRTSANYSDCSSAVFRSMIYGGFLDQGHFIGNTETLFSMGRNGTVMKQIDEKDIRYGDIFVAGTPGQSLGAGGHTGFILNPNTIIHSNYSDNGISVTPRKGRMGDASGYPVRYYRLVGGTSRKLHI